MVVVFSGGGTGGHLYPALALAGALAELREDVKPFFVGAERGIEARILPERGLPHLLVPVEGLRRSLSLSNLGVIARLVSAVRRVVSTLRPMHPGVVVVTGGYASAPAGLAAVLLRVPLVVQEQNETPGVTTRLLARWARQIHVAYPEARRRLPEGVQARVLESGNPVRPPSKIDPLEAREALGLPSSGPVLLVVGGSQGSLALNELMREALPALADSRWQVLWATGPTHYEGLIASLDSMPQNLRLVPYIDDMPKALACADLALSRAGAMTTSEFLSWGVPSVLIPLPTAAANHQKHNALALAAAGVSICIDQSDATGAIIAALVEELGGDEDRLGEMAQKAAERGRPNAAREIAEAVSSLLPPSASGSTATMGGRLG